MDRTHRGRGRQRLRIRASDRRIRREGEKDDPKAATPSWMVRTGVIVTIAASIAGLLTTGIGTLFSSRVAQDQLRQSRDDAEEKRRQQAARVSFWVEEPPDGKARVHLMNRSLDPVTYVNLAFVAVLPGRPVGHQTATFGVFLAGVQPCSELMFSQDDMSYTEANLPLSYHPPYDENPPRGQTWHDLEARPTLMTTKVRFTDRDGVLWERKGGRLAQVQQDPLPVLLANPDVGLEGVVRNVKPQALQSCDKS
ncbi:hypothetical protein ACFWAR_00200 [Streptomyces sp. NPDC059917]|uniref:hypothetical protein n=1 Tax=Streptomyces sp. NPDC059917 TaxID=3347002 RepID=UPI00366845D6